MSKTFPILYVKTSAGNINYWQIWTEGSAVNMQWGKVGTGKPLFDSYCAEEKNVGRSSATTSEQQAELEAQSKFDKQLRLKYVQSIEEAEGGLNIKPMRCYSLDDKRRKKIPFPCTVQPKYNGCRCMAYPVGDNGHIRLMSRGGKDYVVPHIQNELADKIPSGWCLDGELYVHGMSLQRIRSFILTPSEESLSVQFVVYDMTQLPPGDVPWLMRHKHLWDWFSLNPGMQYVRMSPSVAALRMNDIEAAHDEYVRQGYEGCIIRFENGKYKLAAKNTEVLKYKKFQDAEFKVVGWSVGKDDVIVYRCVQEQGLEFEVRPMGDEVERAELLGNANNAIGKLLIVKFQERSDDNVPIFPVGVAFRGEEDLD